MRLMIPPLSHWPASGVTKDGPNEPYDLEALWQRWTKGWFGGKDGGPPPKSPWGGQPPNRSPETGKKNVAWLLLLAVFVAWLMSGVFVLRENQQALVTRLGRFHRMAGPGVNWVLPYPIDQFEVLTLADSGTIEIGEASAPKGSGMPHAAMLTADGAIVQVRLSVQYKLRNPREHVLSQVGDAEQILRQMGAASVRDVVGQMDMAAVLGSAREQIAPLVQKRLQAVLDASGLDMELTAVTAAKDAVRVPEMVQAAFEEVSQVNAGRESAKTQAQAQASAMLSAATQEAQRLREQAQAYKATAIQQAQGEAERFAAILPQYQQAPQATRDYLYSQATQQVFSHVSKVVADSRQAPALNVQIDKTGASATVAAASAGVAASGAAASVAASPASSVGAARPPASAAAPAVRDLRSRDALSLRERK